MPNSDVSKSLAYYENSILEQKINDLKREIIKLDELAKIHKTRKIDDIQKRINDLKSYFQRCKSEIENNDFKIQKEKYKQIEKSYEDLVKFQNEKEKVELANNKKVVKNDKTQVNKEPKKADDIKININTIMQYINESLHSTKNITFKESQELMNKIIQTEKDIKKFNDYIFTCNDVQSKAGVIESFKPAEGNQAKDLRAIDNEIATIHKNIEVIV